MIIKQTNDEGVEVEVEVLTAEEHQAKLNEALSEKDKAMSEEKANLENELAKMKLEGVKEDHPNFKVLKEALAKKDEQINLIQKNVEEDKLLRKKEAIDTMVSTATRGNEELEKKVKYHIETSLAALPDNTPQERQVKLEAALKLSSEFNSPGVFDSGIGGGASAGAFKVSESGSSVEFTARERSLGQKFGISDEDYKKYGPRLTNKK